METGRGADIIDFASAARRIRLCKRRSELQRLRAAHAASMAMRGTPMPWTWFPTAGAVAPTVLARHAMAR